MANYKNTENDVTKSGLFTKPEDLPGGGEEEKKEEKHIDTKVVTMMPFISSEANEGGKDFEAPSGTGSGINREGVVVSSHASEDTGISIGSGEKDPNITSETGFGAYSSMNRKTLKAYADSQGIKWTNRADVTNELFKVNPKAVFKM